MLFGSTSCGMDVQVSTQWKSSWRSVSPTLGAALLQAAKETKTMDVSMTPTPRTPDSRPATPVPARWPGRRAMFDY